MPASGTAKNIHVFTGSDEGRVAEAALLAARRLTPPDAGDFGQDIVDGVAENAETAAKAVYRTIEALRTMPFFGGGKVVWLRNANFLADNVTGKAEDTVSAVNHLGELIEAGLPPDVVFILSAPGMDKRRSFYNILKKHANIEIFDKVDTSKGGWEGRLAPLVQQRARALGLLLGKTEAEYLIHLVGEDTRRLDSELEKTRVYCGPEARVTREDLRAVVSPSRGGIIFELGTAIGERDLQRSLRLLEHFLQLDENPVGILRAAIIPKVRWLLVMRDLMGRHKLDTSSFENFKSQFERLPEDATAHLPKSKSGTISLFPLYLAARESSRFKPAELLEAIDACLEADRSLINTGLEPSLVLSQLLVRVLARPCAVA
ncbi:MAG: DNA polymerase III subunit delta [Verrucomicrobiales bacterium]